MVNFGIVGLGGRWENCYRPVLLKLRNRVRVRAIYDAVETRSEQVAREFNAAVVQGVVALLERTDIQAVLLLDSAWCGDIPFRLVSQQKKPVYVSGHVGNSLEFLEQTHENAVVEGQTLMPEFGRRYTPATSRLRELMATQLGPVLKIVADVTLPPAVHERSEGQSIIGADFLLDWFDWCRYVVRSAPTQIEVIHPEPNLGTVESTSTHQAIRIQYDPSVAGSPKPNRFSLSSHNMRANCAHADLKDSKRQDAKPPTVELSLRQESSARQGQPTTDMSEFFSSLRQEVHCETGLAVLERADSLTWRKGGNDIHESLAAERSEFEVMLDQFCRRVVGGLIPVPDINDICRGLRLINAAEASLVERRPIQLNGNV